MERIIINYWAGVIALGCLGAAFLIASIYKLIEWLDKRGELPKKEAWHRSLRNTPIK